MRLILASQSPRRVELLRTAGYEFDVQPGEVDESHRHSETPRSYVERLASAKSARALDALDGAADLVVIGADTTVVIGEEILGKPRDAEDAARMLRKLSGRTHEVITGVSVRSATLELTTAEITQVTLLQLTEDQIAWYVASGECADKAGAYAIQGLASRFVTRIEGSYSNVVGLPIAAVDAMIQRVTRPSRFLASRG
jgi:septum formation protein